MARIAGINLPKEKRIEVALTYVYGIGRQLSRTMLNELKIDLNTKVKDLTEGDVLKLRDHIGKIPTEGDLRRKVSLDIKRLQEINSYRGSRHRKKLPARGQRTKTNARTKKGKKVTIANKKKVTK
jgi:small subunit ribosomal protein S13